jgi:hypothetical protein
LLRKKVLNSIHISILKLMRKEVSVLFIIAFSLLLLSAISALAQEEEFLSGQEEFLVEEEIIPSERAGMTPDSPIYVFDKIIDNFQLAVASGDDKTRKALEIKEERLAEASVMVDKGKPEAAQSALDLARKASEKAQADIAPDLEKETNEKIRRAARLLTSIQEKLPDQGWEGVETALNAQLDEEERVRIAVLVSKSRLTYCDALAKQDFDLMKGDKLCQIEKAPQWLKERVEGDFTERENRARNQIIDTVSACIVDPKRCDCSNIEISKHSQSCEVKKALAIRCQYEGDDDACSELASESLEDFLPDFIGADAKDSILDVLKEKEQEMFGRFKPEECSGVDTFEDCFDIMKDLYGEPPECEGLDKDECIELIKTMPMEEHGERDFPPECRDAGVTTPLECGELMMEKYGKPPQCEGLDTKECMKLMRHERPDSANFGMPPECKEAGATSPRECFNIMTGKFGFPPECSNLGEDECFEEMMKRGPGGPNGQRGDEFEPSECKDAGVSGDDCFHHMLDLYGAPPECEGLDPGECLEVTKSLDVRGSPRDCIGLSPDECREKLQEQHGFSGDCRNNPEECIGDFEERGFHGGLPTECAGLEREECEVVMVRKFGPSECSEAESKQECEEIMMAKGGQDLQGFGDEFDGEHGDEPSSGFVAPDCRGLSRKECDQRMFERYAPPECEGLGVKECKNRMKEFEDHDRRDFPGQYDDELKDDFDREDYPDNYEDFPREGNDGEDYLGGGYDDVRGEGFDRADDIFSGECSGLNDEECKEKFRGRGDFYDDELEKEDSEYFPPDEEHREDIMPGECEGLLPGECDSLMREKFASDKPYFDEREGEVPSQDDINYDDRLDYKEEYDKQFDDDDYRDEFVDDNQDNYDRGDDGGSDNYQDPQPDYDQQYEEPVHDSPPPEESPGETAGEALDTITGNIVKSFEWLGGR